MSVNFDGISSGDIANYQLSGKTLTLEFGDKAPGLLTPKLSENPAREPSKNQLHKFSSLSQYSALYGPIGTLLDKALEEEKGDILSDPKAYKAAAQGIYESMLAASRGEPSDHNSQIKMTYENSVSSIFDDTVMAVKSAPLFPKDDYTGKVSYVTGGHSYHIGQREMPWSGEPWNEVHMDWAVQSHLNDNVYVTGGEFTNSMGLQGGNFGLGFQTDRNGLFGQGIVRAGVEVGGFTGYPVAPVVPAVIPNVTIGAPAPDLPRLKISALPPVADNPGVVIGQIVIPADPLKL